MYSLLGYHLDYVYFVYGLSFAVLAGVCFSLRNSGDRTLPWVWFGLFGLFHGCNEWLNLLAFSVADRRSLAVVRLAALVFTYLALLEFSRQGIMHVRRKRIGIWIYIPLLLGAVTGWKYGFPGVNATVRYCLGLPAGAASAWLILRASRTHSRPVVRNALFTLSAAFALYALTAGIVVSFSPMPPACWINNRWFLAVTGIPVQIVRAATAVLCAVSVFWYSMAELRFETPFRWRLGKAGIHIWTAGALVVTVLCGWYVTEWIGERELAEVVKDARSDITLLADRLEQTIAKVEQTAQVMSGSPWLLPLLAAEKERDQDKINSVLDRYRRGFDMTICYLLDTDGRCIASSNRDDPDSLVGNSYAFRPYFTGPRAGTPGTCFALGVTHRKKGFYAGVPLYNDEKRFIGAAVVKKELEKLEESFRGVDYSFLIDPHGVIFLCSNRHFDYNSLWPLTDETVDTIRRSRQYGDPRLRPLLEGEVRDGDQIVFEKKNYYVSRTPVSVGGWSLVRFSPLKPVFQVRFLCIVITLFLCVLVIGFFAALREREGMLALIFAADNERKAVLDAATQVAIITTDNSGLVTMFNPGAERMLGYGADEVKGMCRITQFHLPEELAARRCAGKKSAGPPLSDFEMFAAYAIEATARSREWTYVRKDGRRITVDLSVMPIKNKLGETGAYLFVAADITERERAEEAVRASEEQYRNLVAKLPCVVYRCKNDAEWTMSYISGQITVLLGYPAEDFIGNAVRSYASVIYPADRRLVDEAVQKGVSSKQPYDITYRLCRADGKIVWVQEKGQGIFDSAGEFLCLEGVIMDITVRKEAEDALKKAYEDLRQMQTQLVQSEKMAAVGQLAAGMVHQINSPLVSVMENIGAFSRYREKIETFLTELAGVPLDAGVFKKIEALKKKQSLPYILDDLPKLIQETYDGLERIKTIVEGLQTYAGGERGQSEEVDLVQCLGIAADIIGNKLKDKTEMTKRCEAVPPVKGYRREIIHAFTNLLLNALEAVEGGGKIMLTSRAEGGCAVIEVSDTGRGIAPEHLARLFDPFFTTKPAGKGGGLGLPIVKKIIERHKGKIEVKSEVGKGTTVIIRIPAVGS